MTLNNKATIRKCCHAWDMLQLLELCVIVRKHHCTTFHETFTKASQKVHLKGLGNKDKIRLNKASSEVGE